MSSFIPLPGAADQPAPHTVPGDGFFPEIDLVALKAAFRVDPTVTDDRLRDSALVAVIEVARELSAWRGVQVAAGFATLEDVPNRRGPQLVDGLAWSTVLYVRAVSSLIAAELAERTRNAGATVAGHERADELETAADIHRQAYRWALSDLVGRPRTTIELI